MANAQADATASRGQALRQSRQEAASADATTHAASSCPSRFVSMVAPRNSVAEASCQGCRSISQSATSSAAIAKR